MVLQCPSEGAEAAAASRNCFSVICPAASLRRDDGTGAHQFSFVPAVEHWTARQHDGRDVDGRCGHHLGRRGLVAAGGENHRVDRIPVQDFDEPEIREVAIERRRGPAAILENRVQRKFHGHAAGIADAFAYTLDGVEMHPVARREVTAGLCDADDRFARQQLIGREAVVHEALEIERHHVEVFRIVKPVARAESAVGSS